jgi:hypothetical protein
VDGGWLKEVLRERDGLVEETVDGGGLQAAWSIVQWTAGAY